MNEQTEEEEIRNCQSAKADETHRRKNTDSFNQKICSCYTEIPFGLCDVLCFLYLAGVLKPSFCTSSSSFLFAWK